ncbi:PilC/PilY family type IV pilus protein [Piscinibacter sakaiensis]|uniref:Type IV fimbrial biogenesis protein PilY1 n=1 Tax=Piscinibacter sakaiensis TaxID=1547922 RepID=A0A0K8NX04_PISS1|nr:PilC/PilY family type IV pilus protein [Piscinibacter sakaiensis]GAP34814.1 type IV fimbrial biogenesis protein PilY1 [Piscinibacter sakaiensis]
MPDFPPFLRKATAPLLTGAVCAGLALPAGSAVTDIANEPVITRNNVSAKPNLMFILDDSGSMGWSYMPDELGDSNNDPLYGKYGYWSSQCNGLAYDPTVTYLPPLNADGTSFPAMSYTAAKDDGFVSTSSTVNLSGSAYYQYATTGTLQPKMGWTYSSTGAVDTTTTFYRECMSDIGATPGSSKFTRVNMDSATADQKINYANWRSYYARRIMLMRSAVGRAVQALDSSYRVGFSRINSTTITDGANFRDAKVFDATQKTNFYSSLYGAPVGGGTPLRGALSKIGRYYAKAHSGQTYDPVEYSCQRNYALLTTDGYWNLGGSPGVAESSSYGPIDLAGSNVGNTDAVERRPLYDGGTATVTEVTPTTTVTIRRTDTQVRTTTTERRTLYTYAGCGFLSYRRTATPQTRTLSYVTSTTSYSQQTLTSTRTVVTTNGAVTSDTTSNSTTTSVPADPPGSTSVSATTDSGFVNGVASTGTCQVYFSTPSSTATTSSTTTSNVVDPVTSVYNVTGPTVGATTTTTSVSGGTSNTLSDVANYYYRTDLRTAALGNCASRDASNNVTDVCENNVPATDNANPLADNNRAQHMTTFSIGLGVSGTLAYPGDLSALTSGTKSWPAPTTSISGSSGDARNIDDLWHTALNGRGQYYSALSATALSQAISGVVSAIREASGAGTAASFNTLAFVPGSGNRVYQAGYTTASWVGELRAYAVDGATGTVSNTAAWSAKELLDAKAPSSRNIYYRQPGTTVRRDFTYDNLNADGLAATHFANLCSKPIVASQCSGLGANLTAANSASNLVAYLRGDRTNETTNTVSPLYRTRANLLGDIINGAPVYVGKPPFNYTDAGYASFSAAQASRAPMVYVGANDGMLHAFSASTGQEMWAYVPTGVMANMYRLANVSYGNNHTYFVDGEPVVGDVYVGGVWKTILIGGLNAGGRMYYALDITDPANPQPLWEFTDTNLGLSYGNPVITKRQDGTWVVAFGSGLNNTNDGLGRLFVLNAYTGAKLLEIATTAGSAATPSGLAKINAWVDSGGNNTALRIYGGDLLGNLWRFDIDNRVQPNLGAIALGVLRSAGGAIQPITTKPELALIDGTYPVVAVGTGRYLGLSDITDTTPQAIYVLKDGLTAGSGLGNVRSNASVQRITTTNTSTAVSAATGTVDWSTANGWYLDLPSSGERVVANMAVASGVLTASTAVPSGDACTSGGSSWLYRINIASGRSATDGAPVGELYVRDAIIVGLTEAKLSDGSSVIYIKDSRGNQQLRQLPPPTDSSSSSTPRRTSWRELLN